MTDYSDLIQPDKGQDARAIHLVDKKSYDGWLKGRSARERAHLAAVGFKPDAFVHAILPGDDPEKWGVVTAVANVDSLSAWCLAKLGQILPDGRYRVEGAQPGKAMFGWMSGQYRFDTYRPKAEARAPRVLLTSDVGAIAAVVAEMRATALVRDMVNTPAADMGPAAIEKEAERIAKAHGAKLTVTKGEALEQGYPMIHAVGRAAAKHHAPRLIEMVWGKDSHPKVALVGKGISFDSGGLDIKPSAGMRLMKKDMGGAAHVLALAELVMAGGLPVRLHCLVAAAENAISADAFRPGDVLRSRLGLTVEIGNTDAEGRLVLGDALAKASEDKPELIVDFATLTGAARVALGPDLPPLFANDDGLAEAMLTGGIERDDPLWRMPLWDAYADLLETDIADLGNAGSSAFAGTITAALFLKRFVGEGIAWAHIDTFAWRPSAKHGRPKGGAALGLRATWAMLQSRYDRRRKSDAS
ncbi:MULTISPECIES: leucyl aminopeptidase family protein [unclassified Sphingopyxis]|uniref:leucyl aminopeptidase family protein n=1 Tax=unclassified Sphingopyxis TaxID=2614943 RepID=UPI0007362828|nr:MULTISPECIES: leucyl aminopeptidase family protein [unclassified Sphingopyxis]KTE40701.1 aminopeptidase [Sphingopyxis sp. HIX]KTE83969.1 aminopeptidase [Sphingopyxis sp. HXXIV]